MSEQENMDRLLREMMAATPPPSLSSDFDRRIAKEVRPRGLNSIGRRVMIAYAMLALILSVWAMRHQSISWSFVSILISVPLVVVTVVFCSQRTRSRAKLGQAH